MNQNKSGVLSIEDSKYLKEYEKYMKEIPDIGEEKEKNLIEKAIESDEEAQAQLITVYMKKTVKVALKEINKGVSLKRLIEYGNIGVIMEVEKLSDIESAQQMIMYRMQHDIKRCIRYEREDS